MSSIVVAILTVMVVPMTGAIVVNAIRGARAAARTPALVVRCADRGDDRLLLELSVAGSARGARVDGIAVDRAFASRVLAQPPAGFDGAHTTAHDATVTWAGLLRVRRGVALQLAIPMRTDIAATGSFTFLYRYRSGLVHRTSRASIEYRPLLVAVGAGLNPSASNRSSTPRAASCGAGFPPTLPWRGRAGG